MTNEDAKKMKDYVDILNQINTADISITTTGGELYSCGCHGCHCCGCCNCRRCRPDHFYPQQQPVWDRPTYVVCTCPNMLYVPPGHYHNYYCPLHGYGTIIGSGPTC